MSIFYPTRRMANEYAATRGWEFAKGQRVRLISGGPKMTIADLHPDYVLCQWFDGPNLKTGTVKHEALRILKGRQ